MPLPDNGVSGRGRPTYPSPTSRLLLTLLKLLNRLLAGATQRLNR